MGRGSAQVDPHLPTAEKRKVTETEQFFPCLVPYTVIEGNELNIVLRFDYNFKIILSVFYKFNVIIDNQLVICFLPLNWSFFSFL